MTDEEHAPTQVEGHRIVAEVGGLVDEFHATIGVYGEELEPDEITRVLGCAPTSSHRRGDSRRPGGPGAKRGAWLLTVTAMAPTEPEEVLQQLLGRVPGDPEVWARLASMYSVQVRIGIFIGAWTRGFELSPAVVRQLAALGVPVGFSIYADGEEPSEDG